MARDNFWTMRKRWLVGGLSVVLAIGVGSGAWFWWSTRDEQSCPATLPAGYNICTPIPGGTHPSDGLPAGPITVREVRAQVDSLQVYPGSLNVRYHDEIPESVARGGNLVGYSAAQSTKTMDVYAVPSAMLAWYRAAMVKAGWTALPVTYGAPQLTVRYFRRGRRFATLNIYAADYLPLRSLSYDLAAQISPYRCNGASSCGLAEISIALGL